MKKVVYFFLAFVLSSVFVFPGGETEKNTSTPSTIVLRYAETQPEGGGMVASARKFAELVEQKSDGKIRVEVFPGGQLGAEIDQLSSLQMGTLDIATTGTNVLPEFGIKKLSAFALPYVFRNDDHFWNVIESDFAQKLLTEEPVKVGSKMIGLFYLDMGPRNFFTRTPVNSIGDMRGLKIRTPSSKIMIDTVAALGASPTPLSYSELYSAIQTGTVDGGENALEGYNTSKLYEVAPYCILDGHTRVPMLALMSESVWNKLGEENQQIIREAALETQNFNKEDGKRRSNEYRKAAEAAGATIVDVVDKTPWQEATKSVIVANSEGSEDVIEFLASK